MPIRDTAIDSRVKNKLIIFLAIVIVFSSLMITATTLVFFKSSAYGTVKQIQAGTQISDTFDQSGLDVTSPINAVDIDKLAESVYLKVQALDDNADFGSDSVSDSSLGLTL